MGAAFVFELCGFAVLVNAATASATNVQKRDTVHHRIDNIDKRNMRRFVGTNVTVATYSRITILTKRFAPGREPKTVV